MGIFNFLSKKDEMKIKLEKLRLEAIEYKKEAKEATNHLREAFEKKKEKQVA